REQREDLLSQMLAGIVVPGVDDVASRLAHSTPDWPYGQLLNYADDIRAIAKTRPDAHVSKEEFETLFDRKGQALKLGFMRRGFDIEAPQLKWDDTMDYGKLI